MVRAITSGVVLKPETGDATVRFHAVPQVASTNAERTGVSALSSHYTIAGARYVAGERTCKVRMRRWPRSWRIAA